MAGTNVAFDAAAFRTAIRSTMTMGLPSNTPDRATFRWDAIKNYSKEDSEGKPYDWTVSPTTSITFPDVQIPVAVEFASGASLNTNVGQFDTSRAILTVLDVDFALLTVTGVQANRVLLGGNTYDWEFTAPPLGLFEVTIYQIHVVALDES